MQFTPNSSSIKRILTVDLGKAMGIYVNGHYRLNMPLLTMLFDLFNSPENLVVLTIRSTRRPPSIDPTALSEILIYSILQETDIYTDIEQSTFESFQKILLGNSYRDQGLSISEERFIEHASSCFQTNLPHLAKNISEVDCAKRIKIGTQIFHTYKELLYNALSFPRQSKNSYLSNLGEHSVRTFKLMHDSKIGNAYFEIMLAAKVLQQTNAHIELPMLYIADKDNSVDYYKQCFPCSAKSFIETGLVPGDLYKSAVIHSFLRAQPCNLSTKYTEFHKVPQATIETSSIYYPLYYQQLADAVLETISLLTPYTKQLTLLILNHLNESKEDKPNQLYVWHLLRQYFYLLRLFPHEIPSIIYLSTAIMSIPIVGPTYDDDYTSNILQEIEMLLNADDTDLSTQSIGQLSTYEQPSLANSLALDDLTSFSSPFTPGFTNGARNLLPSPTDYESCIQREQSSNLKR